MFKRKSPTLIENSQSPSSSEEMKSRINSIEEEIKKFEGDIDYVFLNFNSEYGNIYVSIDLFPALKEFFIKLLNKVLKKIRLT